MIALLNSGLRPNLDGGLNTVGNEYSAECVEREAALMAGDDPTPEELEALDLVDLCLYCGIYPSRIHALVKGLDRSDEIAISDAIYRGINDMRPDLSQYASIFIRHFYTADVPEASVMAVDTTLMAAE